MRIITENIENEILYELSKAEKSIDIAVAWITSERLINKIEEKKNAEVRIRILCWKDEEGQNINMKLKRRFPIKKKNEFEIYEIEKQHNKFCIIDNVVVIEGSYNWTEAAKTNEENIKIINNNPEVISSFQEIFDNLRQRVINSKDNKQLKRDVLESAKEEILLNFNQNVEKYVRDLAEMNKQILYDVEEKIEKKKIEIESFEKRTRLYKNIIVVSIILLLISLLIIGLTIKNSIDWYKTSILTKEEVREQLLKEFDSRNMKLYNKEEYKMLERNNKVLEEWISKNPRDSRKFIEYRNKNKR